MIRGFIRGRSPRIIGRVSLPSLSMRTVAVEFLIDTGASVTVLPLAVLVDLGVDSEELRTMPLEQNISGGGTVLHALHRGELEFTLDDGADVGYRVLFRLALEPPPDRVEVPCVLGMDVLENFRLTVSVREGRVEMVRV